MTKGKVGARQNDTARSCQLLQPQRGLDSGLGPPLTPPIIDHVIYPHESITSNRRYL